MRSDITLYFVRHGETDWNKVQRYQGQTDIPLNDLGRTQAQRNGRIIKADIGDRPVDDFHFVASPLSRASETMQLAREAMGLPREPFVRDDRLKEQHFGHWEGVLYGEMKDYDPEGFAARTADMWGWVPQGGENYPMVRARVQTWLDELTRDTVVVSHGNIGRCLRGMLLGMSELDVPILPAPQDKVLKFAGGNGVWI